MSLTEKVLATMKCNETEGPFELYVTRTPGYLWAQFFRVLHVHPNVVTIMSIIMGSVGGCCFASKDLWINILGMCLLIWANWWDCADGQLARMTNQKTELGRLLDGAGGLVWFWFIYWSLVFRMFSWHIEIVDWREDWGIWIFFINCMAGFICHQRQAALADYYRNIHMYFTLGKDKSELDRTETLKKRMSELTWDRKDWFEHIYLTFYTSYTKGQENQTPMFQELMKALSRCHADTLPERLVPEFRRRSKPLMKWCNVLTHDSRVIVLFTSLLIGIPVIYPFFEIFVLGSLHIWVRRKHEAICKDLIAELDEQ